MNKKRIQTKKIRELYTKLRNSPVTVIWSRPDSNYLVIEHPFITFHYQLVGTANIIDIIGVVKICHNATTKKETSTTGTQPPAIDNVLWV